MKRILLYLFPFVYMLTSVSCMSSKNDSVRMAMEVNKEKVAKDKMCDAGFAVCVADIGMLEAKLSDLAQIYSTTPSVKNLAAIMEKEHSKEHNELKGLAAKRGFTLPETLSERSQKRYDELAEKKGRKFDKAYIKCNKKISKKELCEFKKEARAGKDPEMKAWADANILAVKNQITETKEACKKMKDGK